MVIGAVTQCEVRVGQCYTVRILATLTDNISKIRPDVPKRITESENMRKYLPVCEISVR